MEIEYTSEFRRNLRQLARRYRNIKKDIAPIIKELAEGKTPGDQIPRVGYTVYKVRVKNSDSQKGKSGGYRVIYYIQTETHITLVTLYSKLDQSDVSSEKIRQIVENNEKPDNE